MDPSALQSLTTARITSSSAAIGTQGSGATSSPKEHDIMVRIACLEWIVAFSICTAGCSDNPGTPDDVAAGDDTTGSSGGSSGTEAAGGAVMGGSGSTNTTGGNRNLGGNGGGAPREASTPPPNAAGRGPGVGRGASKAAAAH